MQGVVTLKFILSFFPKLKGETFETAYCIIVPDNLFFFGITNRIG